MLFKNQVWLALSLCLTVSATSFGQSTTFDEFGRSSPSLSASLELPKFELASEHTSSELYRIRDTIQQIHEKLESGLVDEARSMLSSMDHPNIEHLPIELGERLEFAYVLVNFKRSLDVKLATQKHISFDTEIPHVEDTVATEFASIEAQSKANREFQAKSISRWIFAACLGLVALLSGAFGLRKYLAHRNKLAPALTRCLDSRDPLFQERNNRIGENLRIISSIEYPQIGDSYDSAAVGIDVRKNNGQHFLQGIKSRMHSVSEFRREFQRMNFGQGLSVDELIAKLLSHYVSTASRPVELRIKADRFFLDSNTTMALGLIICEVLSNAVEHGLQDVENPVIDVILKNNRYESWSLFIGDNGPGSEVSFSIPGDTRLGLSIIENFCEQIDSTVEIFNRLDTGGACVLIKSVVGIKAPEEALEIAA